MRHFFESLGEMVLYMLIFGSAFAVLNGVYSYITSF